MKSADIKHIEFKRNRFIDKSIVSKKNITNFESIKWNKIICTYHISTNLTDDVPLLYLNDGNNYFSDTVIVDYVERGTNTIKRE